MTNLPFLLGPRRRERSREFDPGAAFFAVSNSFYFNALILELLDLVRGDAPPSEAERAASDALLKEFETDCFACDGGAAMAWGYFPLKHHRFRSDSFFLKLMFKWGAAAADLDSSSVVICRLLKAGSTMARPADILALLADHVHGKGRFGKNALAYDNGSRAEDRGILLWVEEKHNELDAGVNLNILCLLAALLEKSDPREQDLACGLARGIFDYLDSHLARGSFARPDFLMYYSLDVFSFLWYRLAVSLEGMAPDRLRAFDPKGVCEKLGAYLCATLSAELRRAPAAFNAFDRAMILPLLLRRGSPAASGLIEEAAFSGMLEALKRKTHAFGKFIYPFTFLYGNQAMGICAAMAALRELKTSAAPSAGG